MTPFYQDEWITLYVGDVREILPQMQAVRMAANPGGSLVGVK